MEKAAYVNSNFYFLQKWRDPFIKMGIYLTIFVLAIVLLSTKAYAQAVSPGLAPVIPPAGKFAMDGNLKANTPVPGLGDWLPASGTGGAVLDAFGVAINNSTTYHLLDLFNTGDNTFEGGQKKNDNPNTMKWKLGNPSPAKCDINNLLLHTGDDPNGDTWITLSGDRESTNGNSFISLALHQKRVIANSNGTFTSDASNNTGGRTLGDVQISAEFTGGGVNPNLYLEEWRLLNGVYQWVAFSVNNVVAYGSTNAAQLTGLPYTAFGFDYYEINAFIEVSINISEVYRNTATACVGSISSMFVMTKSSQAEKADLSDFVEPIQLNLDVNVGKPTAVGASYCVGAIVDALTATGETGAIFKWYTNLDADGKPTGTSSTGSSYTPNVNTSTPGVTNFYVTQTVKGCESQPTIVPVTVNPNATSVAGTAPAAQCYNSVNGSTFALDGSGTNGTPKWTVLTNTSNLTVSFSNDAIFKPNVNVNGGTGSVTLRLTVTSGYTPSCGTPTSDVIVTVNPNATASAGTAPAQQCYDAANGNTFALDGSGTNGTPKWTVLTNTSNLTVGFSNDAIFKPNVTVSGGSGSVTLRLTVNNGSVPSCGNPTSDVTVIINPNATASAGAAPAAQCYDAVNGNTFALDGSGANGTPKWTVLSNANNLTVGFSNDGIFKPNVNISGGSGSVTFRLTVTSGFTPVCGTPTSDVTVTVNSNATASAGTAPAAECYDEVAGNTFALDGSGTNGTPKWTVLTNTSNLTVGFSNDGIFKPNVNVSGGSGTVTLRLTVSSNFVPACNNPTSDVTVTVNPLPTAGAGNDPATQCYNANGNIFNLTGTGLNGNPAWAIAPNGNPAGLNVQFTGGNSLTPSITISGNANGGTVTIRLTVTSNTTPACGSIYDDVSLTVGPQVGAPDAIMITPLCTDKTFKLQVTSPVDGTKYTVTQPLNGNPYSSEFTFDGTNGPVIFSGLTFGDGFTVIASKNGCTSAILSCPVQQLLSVGNQTSQAPPAVNASIDANDQSKVLAYPNPYSDRIRFDLRSSVSGQGSLELYNMLGQKVKTIYQGYFEAGRSRNIEYNVPSAQRANLVYIFRVNNQRTTGKLINIRR